MVIAIHGGSDLVGTLRFLDDATGAPIDLSGNAIDIVRPSLPQLTDMVVITPSSEMDAAPQAVWAIGHEDTAALTGQTVSWCFRTRRTSDGFTTVFPAVTVRFL